MSMQKITLESIPWPVTAPEPAHRPTIMIVDDSATVRKIVEVSLQRAGYAVVSCADGVEALRVLLASDVPLPDLILLDIEMPRMNGYQLARFCQRKPQLACIPLVMLSRRVGVVDRLKARLCHVSASLSKPFTTEQLLTVVTTTLGQPPLLSPAQE